jgi:cation diffusion facilitator CzcD-associated flavoprotein CzcO
MRDVIVIGAGPAGVLAAFRAADLGARTALITRDAFGGMAANDGPVPVRTLAHAARLLREARQIGQYGIALSAPMLEYPRLLTRVREVAHAVRTHTLRREDIDRLGVTIYEQAGTVRFVDPHTIETASGLRLQADKIILCAGGTSRRLSVPGFALTATHSDAWSLTAVPPSMLVVGGGATGVQVASIFNAFGSRVQLFQVPATLGVDVPAMTMPPPLPTSMSGNVANTKALNAKICMASSILLWLRSWDRSHVRRERCLRLAQSSPPPGPCSRAGDPRHLNPPHESAAAFKRWSVEAPFAGWNYGFSLTVTPDSDGSNRTSLRSVATVTVTTTSTPCSFSRISVLVGRSGSTAPMVRL